LASTFGAAHGGGRRSWTAVVIAGSGGVAAIGVDRMVSTGKVVVRPLPAGMAPSPIIAGASLDAEGNPQLVLDPDALVAVAERSQGRAASVLPAKRLVLVVDDSLTTRMLEKSILESAGYDVDVATSGEEALSRVRDQRYALILVDVDMPGMDGF